MFNLFFYFTSIHLFIFASPLFSYYNQEIVDLGKDDQFLVTFPEEKTLYDSIKDIYHPTLKDYQNIQDFLQSNKREYIKWLNIFNEPGYTDSCRYDLRAINLTIVSQNSSDYLLEKVYYKTDAEDKDFCIVTYGSISNDGQRKGQIERLKNKLYKVGYKGHLLYRTAGWPDVEGGSLKLIHVPYSFKVCMIQEARRLGYKKILWLDTSIVPMNNLEKIKTSIEDNGYFFTYLSDLTLYRYTSLKLSNFYNLSDEDNKSKIKPIAGGIVGFNFNSLSGSYLFDAWYDSALDLDPWLSPRPDQNVLSVLAYLMDIEPTDSLSNVAFEKWRHFKFKHSFYIDRIKN